MHVASGIVAATAATACPSDDAGCNVGPGMSQWGMAWFRRKQDDDESMDPQVLLARAETATPMVSVAKAPAGFRMTVSDVFSIKGRGTVVTGTVESGTVSTGDTVHLTRADGSTRDVTIDGIEAFRKMLKVANAGDVVGLLVRRLARDDIAKDDVLTY